MKKSKIFKSMISILLVLCMMFSMVAVATTSASAFVGTYALTKACDKLVELGVRAACAATLEMSELLNEDQQETVESICSILLMDAAEKAIADVQEMCEEILNELYVVEQKLTDYTKELGSSEQDDKVSTAKKNYTDEWSNSFYDVLDSQNVYMDDTFYAYVKYLVVSTLNQKGGYPTEQAEIDMLQNFAENWKIKISPTDVTEDGVAQAKRDLATAFCQMYNSSSINEEKTYCSTKVNSAFVDTINALLGELKGNKDDPHLLSYAATFAYYALPYEHQQYEFVYGVAKSHIMKIILLEMAYNEYLACQGEYLCNKYSGTYDNWADENLLDDGTCSYNSLKTAMVGTENESGLLANVADACGEYLDSTIYINTTSETGSPVDIETHLGEYIKPEDAVPVNLTINGYESEHNYYDELATHNQIGGGLSTIDSTEITKQNQINSNTLKFNRVVPGNESGEVYYILDPTQFASPLETKNIVHQIRRQGLIFDTSGGDIYIASCDYLNLTKKMSDGTNTYICPKDLSNAIKNLFSTSAFKAYYKYDTDYYLSDFGYINPSSKLYAISSNYGPDYSGGASLVKSGDLYMQNLNTSSDVSLTFDIKEYNLKDDLYEQSGNYTVILKNTSSEYLQSANVKKNDVADSVQDIKIAYNGQEIGLDSSGTIKPGEKINIKFKVDDNTFASLKCVRNNATQTETVLINGEDELQCFDKDDNGYYNFEYYMPYSNVTFVIETKEPTLPQDENGSFIISSYSDLCIMSKNINERKEEYISGNYIVVNDITAPEGSQFTPMVQFQGTFDGQGHTISGLYVEGDERVGLFKYNEGTIKNIGIVDSYFKGTGYVGSIVAVNKGGTVSNCYSTGEVFCDDNSGGGVVGYNINGGKVTKCYNTGSVSGYWRAGGVVGYNEYGIVENCYNTGTIDAHYNAGGVVGYNDGLSGDSEHDGIITNSYNIGEVTAVNNAGGIVGCNYYGQVRNCYNIDTISDIGYDYGDGDPREVYAKSAEQFKSGEVAYLLNKEVTDGTQAWYQNIDNGLTPDESPVLVNNNQNTVYKVDLKNKTYSNTEQEEIDPSLLTQEDLRTYQRIIEPNGKLSETSKIAMGYGKVDNNNNVITVYMADTADRMGVLMHQGVDGKKGVLKLQGDYPKYSETSGELLRNPDFEEPAIYTDGNGCIFIAQPEDGSEIPELTVQYTAKPVEDNEPVLYTLKVEIIDTSLFKQGNFAGGKILSTLSETDPDYNVIMSEYVDDKNETPTQPETDKKPTDDKQSTTDEATKNTNSNNGTVKTGATSSAVVLLLVMISLTVGVFAYRRKENKE